MANQPKKYTKFVATAATATLVASAIVPVASAATPSFPDIAGNDHAAAIEAIAELGFISGKADGTFAPNEQLTRSHAVYILGNWAKASGLEVPADYKTVQRFKDVPLTADDKFLQLTALLKDNGIFEGTNGNLNPNGKFQRQHMAVVLNSAFEAITGTSLVEVAGDTSDVTVGDLDKVIADYRTQVLALKKLGVTTPANFNPSGIVTRGQFATFLNATIKVEAPEVALESVKAINSKTLEVKFNTAADVTAADFTVNKGTVKSNVANVVIADDKKSATIELTSKLTEGEYKVTVAQKDADALTGSVTVENEKVAAIEVLSDVAPFSGEESATVAVKISNQYNEDVTKAYAAGVVETVGGIASSASLSNEGVLALTLKEGAKEGDKATITLVHGTTGVSTTKTVTLSAASTTSEISFGTLYNKDGKALTQDTNVSTNKFYLPITVKDQYGKEYTTEDIEQINDEVLFTNTNPSIVTYKIEEGSDDSSVQAVTIDGKEVLALEVSRVSLAGTANLIAVSTTTGKSAQTSVTVAEGVKINSVAVSTPNELVTAGKDAYFPLTIVDTNGTAITTKKQLDALTVDGLSANSNYVIGEVSGKEGLYVTVPGSDIVKDRPVTVVVTSTSGKVATQTVTPKAEAVATVITGLSTDVEAALRAGKPGVTVSNTDLVVEDQFGQIITDEEVLEELTFEAESSDVNTISVTENDNGTFTIAPVANTTKTSAKVTFKLVDEDAHAVDASAFTKTFTIVKDADFASYTVSDIPTVFVVETDDQEGKFEVAEGYEKDVVVKAKTANGQVVSLEEGTDFTVVGYAQDNITFASGATTTTKTITITINATGEQFTKEVTYSNVAPKAEKIELVTNTTGANVIAGTVKPTYVTSKEVEEVVDIETIAGLVDIIVTDQYGVQTLADDSVDTLTFTKVSGTVAFDSNGTLEASVVEAKADSVVNAIINIDGKTVTLKLTFTEDATVEVEEVTPEEEEVVGEDTGAEI